MLEHMAHTGSARRTWLEVDTGAIENNTRLMQQLVGKHCAVFGVVKANAYGHGAVAAAQAMIRGGARMLAVATVGEGRVLRRAGINAEILVLGPAWKDEIGLAVRLDLTLTVGDQATFQAIGDVADGRVRAHLKIDTGMHRLGLLPNEAVPMLRAEPAAHLIDWQGICTHFACADEPERIDTARQIVCFEQVRAALANAGWTFPIAHAANSAGALAFSHARYDAVRPGIALYGVAPSADVPLPTGFVPAMRVCTRVVRVADLPAGAAVSYGGRYVAPSPRRIATIAAGYADGLRRAPAWRGVLLHGQFAPIVGRICMDYAMIDVTDVAGDVGDEVVLLGAQGTAAISAETVATWIDTTAYEVLASVGR